MSSIRKTGAYGHTQEQIKIKEGALKAREENQRIKKALLMHEIRQYLNGRDDGSTEGMLNALSNKQVSYKDGETDINVGSYITAEEEQRLKDYVGKVKNDNAYFYGGDGKEDADTVFRTYYDLIEGQGSKNADYQGYLKWDAEQKRIEAEKKAQADREAAAKMPENYTMRAAVANIDLGKPLPTNSLYSGKNYLINGQKYVMTGTVNPTITSQLRKEYSNAIAGDVVEYKQKKYVLSDSGNWRYLIAQKN